MTTFLGNDSVLKKVLHFLLPYLLSYFLQTLYGMADLLIIGRFDGVAATTAVSIGSQVMHMLTVMIVGLAMGSTVSIAQAVGYTDLKHFTAVFRRHMGMTPRAFRSRMTAGTAKAWEGQKKAADTPQGQGG